MAPDQTSQVWSSIDEDIRQEVTNQIQQVIKEMIDEHFRFSPVSTPDSKSQNLRQTVQPPSSHSQHRESEDAVRAA